MPSVDAGVLDIRDLIGYRRQMVFLRGSLHSPPHYDYVRDAMTTLQECFESEDDAFVRAVLGHWLFGFIHLYMDGWKWSYGQVHDELNVSLRWLSVDYNPG